MFNNSAFPPPIIARKLNQQTVMIWDIDNAH
jgi:hypothetical protein